MSRTLQEQMAKKDVKEAMGQVLTNWLVRKVAIQNGVRYEITDAGWRLVKECEDTQYGLGENRSKSAMENNGIPVDGRMYL